MSESDVIFGIAIILGFICVIGGLGSFLVYQRQGEIGINLFLLGLGFFCVIGSYFALSKESKALINSFLAKLGIVKEKLVSCVDCSSYVGQYEVSIRYREGRSVIHQEPRFSEGICMQQGMLIHDGFRQRRCIHFQQRRT
jgi:hypothetical protein